MFESINKIRHLIKYHDWGVDVNKYKYTKQIVNLTTKLSNDQFNLINLITQSHIEEGNKVKCLVNLLKKAKLKKITTFPSQNV